jgi:hypothetical protein
MTNIGYSHIRTLILDEIDVAAQEARLRKIREVLAGRRRYLEILA